MPIVKKKIPTIKTIFIDVLMFSSPTEKQKARPLNQKPRQRARRPEAAI